MRLSLFAAGTAIAMTAGAAFGDYTLTQGASAPMYGDHQITFDEDGVPTGAVGDPFTFYQASDGVTFTSGNGFLGVEDWDTLDGIDGGEGMGNQLAGGFNIRMVFDQDISEISFQGWAIGNGFPFGGINFWLYLDDVQVATYNGENPPFGGVGDEWFNGVGTDGMVFDEVRFFNPAFNSFTSYMDNISWNVAPVPAPGALALIGLAGLVGSRRRRNNA